jgi:hypothetical protein
MVEAGFRLKRSVAIAAVAVFLLHAAGWYLSGLVPAFDRLFGPLNPFWTVGALGVAFGVAAGIRRKSWSWGFSIALGACIGTAAAFGVLFLLFLKYGGD